MSYDYFPKEFLNKLNNEFSTFYDNNQTIYAAKCKKYEKSHWISASFLHFEDTFLTLISATSDVSGLGTIILTAVCLMLFPFFFIVKVCYKSRYKRFKEKVMKDTDKKISESKVKLEKDYQAYLTGFNNEVQSLTTRYAEGRPFTRIADELFLYLKEYVNHADRASYIERIQVECSFSVLKHGILFVNWEGNEMIYSFEKARFDDLPGPVSQAAVARVLANKMQLLFMENSTDPSGTCATVSTREEYTNSSAVFTLTYIAPNGNYVAPQRW